MIEASRYPDLFRSIVKYPDNYVAAGLDSNVYVFGSDVWKLYIKTQPNLGCYDNALASVSPTCLEFYCQVTNCAASLAKRANLTFPSSDSSPVIRILINPVEEYWWECAHGFGIARSKFISGPQLNKDSALSLGLSLDNHDIDKILWEKSSLLDQLLGVRGIHLSRLNTKVDCKNVVLVVTDLCCDLPGLRKGKKTSVLQ